MSRPSRSCRNKGGTVVVPATIPSSDIATLKNVHVMNFNGHYNLTVNLHLLTLAPCAASVDTAVLQTEDLLKLYLVRGKGTIYLCASLTVPTIVDKTTHFMTVMDFPEKGKSTAVDVMPDAWIKEYFGGLVGNLVDNLSYEVALVLIHAVSSCPTIYTGLNSFEVPIDLELSLEKQLGMGELDNVKGKVKHFGSAPRFYDIATTWCSEEQESRPIVGMMFFRDREMICINENTTCLIVAYAAVNAVVKEKDAPYTIAFSMMNGDLLIFEFCEFMRRVTFTNLIDYLAERVDVSFEVVNIDNYVYDVRNQQYVSNNQAIDSSTLQVTIDHSIILSDSEEFVHQDVLMETVVTDDTDVVADVLNESILSESPADENSVESILGDVLNQLTVRESDASSVREDSATTGSESPVREDSAAEGSGSPVREDSAAEGSGSPVREDSAAEGSGSPVRENSAAEGSGSPSPVREDSAATQTAIQNFGSVFGETSIASIGSSPPSPARASTPNPIASGDPSISRIGRLFRDVGDWTICRPSPPLPVEPLDRDGRYKGARYYKDVRINPEIHVQLIGKKCCTLQKLRDEFDVDLDFAQSTDEDPWLIRVYGGSWNGVEDCKDRLWLYATNICKSRTINRQAKEKAAKKKPKPKSAPTRIMVKVPLPYAFHEFVIGLRGAQDPLRLAFNEKFDVSITGPREDADNKDEVMIVGEPPNVESAETAINNERRIYTKMPKRTFILEFHVIHRILGKNEDAIAKTVKVNKLKHIQISKEDNETVTVYGSTENVVDKAEDKFLSHQLRLNEAAANAIKKKERADERQKKKVEKEKDAQLKAKSKADAKKKPRKRPSPELESDDEDIVEDSMIEVNRRPRFDPPSPPPSAPLPSSPQEVLTGYTAVHQETFVFDQQSSDDDGDVQGDQAGASIPPAEKKNKGPPAKKVPRQDVYIRRAIAARVDAVVADLSDEEITTDFTNAPYEETIATATQMRDRLNLLKKKGKQERDKQLALGVAAKAPKPKVVVPSLIPSLPPVSAVAPTQSMVTRDNRLWLLVLFNKWRGRRFPITTTWSNVDRQMKVVAYKVAAAHVHTQWTADYWELQLKVGKYYMSVRERAMETPEQRAAKYKKQSACRRLRFARLRAQKLGLPPPTKADMEKIEEEKRALMGDAYVDPNIEPVKENDEEVDVIVPHAEGEHDFTMYESDVGEEEGDERDENTAVEENTAPEENTAVEENTAPEEALPTYEDQFAPEEEPEQEEYQDDEQAFNSDDDEEDSGEEMTGGGDHNATDAFNDFYGFA